MAALSRRISPMVSLECVRSVIAWDSQSTGLSPHRRMRSINNNGITSQALIGCGNNLMKNIPHRLVTGSLWAAALGVCFSLPGFATGSNFQTPHALVQSAGGELHFDESITLGIRLDGSTPTAMRTKRV
jgi:hypothetical protein